MADSLEQAYASGEDLGEMPDDELPYDLLEALASEFDPRMEQFRDLMRERGWARWIRAERIPEPPA